MDDYLVTKKIKVCKSLKQTYYEILLYRITHGIYNSGDIITEKILVEEFEVSKSPIREALLDLCKDELLKCIPRYGYEVCLFSEKLVNELIEFRTILECSYLRKNFHLITQDDIIDLEKYCLNFDETEPNEALLHWKKNSSFHLKLFSFYNNEFAYNELITLLRKLGIVYVRNYWNIFHNTRIITFNEPHKEILVSLKEGNLEQTLEWLNKDIYKFFEIDQQIKK